LYLRDFDAGGTGVCSVNRVHILQNNTAVKNNKCKGKVYGKGTLKIKDLEFI
jgi:hypothetical protein